MSQYKWKRVYQPAPAVKSSPAQLQFQTDCLKGNMKSTEGVKHMPCLVRLSQTGSFSSFVWLICVSVNLVIKLGCGINMNMVQS